MSATLTRWNLVTPDEAEHEILPCCGSQVWAHEMAVRRPLADEASILSAAQEIWRNLSEADWIEAFRSHPRIGETRPEQPSHARSAGWSAQEQRNAGAAGDVAKMALAEANLEYEKRFGRIFIVCANGKSAPEILEILKLRMQNDPQAELHEAAEQQLQIMILRIKSWLGE